MWWECESCGGVVEVLNAPVVCGECGMAGPGLGGRGPAPSRAVPFETLREAWLQAGFRAEKGGRHATHAR